jgi:hypothetical protein
MAAGGVSSGFALIAGKGFLQSTAAARLWSRWSGALPRSQQHHSASDSPFKTPSPRNADNSRAACVPLGDADICNACVNSSESHTVLSIVFKYAEPYQLGGHYVDHLLSWSIGLEVTAPETTIVQSSPAGHFLDIFFGTIKP